jgi:hypothetical protein
MIDVAMPPSAPEMLATPPQLKEEVGGAYELGLVKVWWTP